MSKVCLENLFRRCFCLLKCVFIVLFFACFYFVLGCVCLLRVVFGCCFGLRSVVLGCVLTFFGCFALFDLVSLCLICCCFMMF